MLIVVSLFLYIFVLSKITARCCCEAPSGEAGARGVSRFFVCMRIVLALSYVIFVKRSVVFWPLNIFLEGLFVLGIENG